MTQHELSYIMGLLPHIWSCKVAYNRSILWVFLWNWIIGKNKFLIPKRGELCLSISSRVTSSPYFFLPIKSFKLDKFFINFKFSVKKMIKFFTKKLESEYGWPISLDPSLCPPLTTMLYSTRNLSHQLIKTGIISWIPTRHYTGLNDIHIRQSK